MSLDNDDNVLPFADCGFEPDVPLDPPVFQNSKYKAKKKWRKQPSNETKNNSHNTESHIYFENTEEENNFLTLIPYTGPRNTSHLQKHLYLPQLTSNSASDSTISFQHFIQDYDRKITSLTPSLETMPLSIYLRFGISYIIRANVTHGQPLSLREFTDLRNQGLKFEPLN
jgi:hypothetical protein